MKVYSRNTLDYLFKMKDWRKNYFFSVFLIWIRRKHGIYLMSMFAISTHIALEGFQLEKGRRNIVNWNLHYNIVRMVFSRNLRCVNELRKVGNRYSSETWREERLEYQKMEFSIKATWRNAYGTLKVITLIEVIH